MKVRELLIDDRSKEACLHILSVISEDRIELNEYVSCLCSKDRFLSSRAARVLYYITDLCPSLIDPYESIILARIKTKLCAQALNRAVLRHWAEHGYSEGIEVEAYNMGFFFLETISPVAVKAHAMYVCMRLVRKYPELAGEFLALMEGLMMKHSDGSAAGIRSRGSKVLKELQAYI